MIFRLFFYLILFFLTLGQFSVLPIDLGFRVYIFDILMIVYGFCGVLFVYYNSKTNKTPQNTTASFYLPISLVFLLSFALTGAISLLYNSLKYNGIELLISTFYLIRFISYLLSAFVISQLVRQKIIALTQILNAIIISGLVIGVLGLIQLVILPDFTVLDSSLGWDPHKNRLASTFFDPNFTGAYLAICFAITYEKVFNLYSNFNKNFFNSRFFNILVLLFFFVSIILTFSRSAWLFLSIVLFVYGITRHRVLLFLGPLIIFSAYYVVPRVQTRIAGITDPSDSAHFRLLSWENALKVSQDHLLIGVGFNTYRYVQDEYGFFAPGHLGGNSGAGADSSFLFVLATTGIIGLVLFILGFVYPVFSLDPLYLALAAGLVFNSMFINSIFYPQILFVWLILWFINLDVMNLLRRLQKTFLL